MQLSSISVQEHSYILAGDIGGTNTTIALMEVKSGSISCVKKASFRSTELTGIEDVLSACMKDFSPLAGYQGIQGGCFTAAGPVEKNRCQLTNIAWAIDGNSIGRRFGFPVFVINDLSGICYGLPLLDAEDSQKLLPLPHPDGTFPTGQLLHEEAEVRAVVAPGTGLGVGFLIKQNGRYLALPSEGGHADWGAYSDETREMQTWLRHKMGKNPGGEQFVSGIGLENIFLFFVEAKIHPVSAVAESILGHEIGQRAALVSAHAHEDHLCSKVMELFVTNCARFASSVALTLLPQSGLFLAGGIPSKNRHWFAENDRFMKTFLQNYRAPMQAQLQKIPVYIALDYSVNLYGAAHAWFSLSA